MVSSQAPRGRRPHPDTSGRGPHPDPEAVFAQIAHRPGSVWLDGGAAPDGWSILAWDPVEVVTEGEAWPERGRALTRGDGGGPPFSGGVIGYVGFGAGHRVEPVPPQSATLEPEVWLARYEGALCLRHRDGTWHPTGHPAMVADAERLLVGARPLPPPEPATPRPARTVSRERHEAGVRRILDWLAAGDCYQVNLTRSVHLQAAGDPFQAWRRLRRLSAPPYGAFLRLSERLVVQSNSPELLLEVRGRDVASVPIKGTRPRDVQRDAALAAELLASPKDRAELTMIVDLVRNDLSRVCRPGTVRAGPRIVTPHANVHHASQRVEGRLEEGRDAWDALAAAFPPGSVTGAPKVRACQRIAELEDEPRGVYCGAIGYADAGGDASWSVAIRTAVWDGDAVRYHVGGGIVADSVPSDEWAETVHKGTVLGAALGATDQAAS